MKQILVVLLLILSGTVLAQFPENGLVCRYPFSGNANDASDNGKSWHCPRGCSRG